MHGLVIEEKNVNFDLLCRDDDTGEEFLVEVQNAEEDQCRTLLEKFIFSMKYMHTMKKRPASFDDPMLNRLYTAAELANLTVKQRQNYDNQPCDSLQPTF